MARQAGLMNIKGTIEDFTFYQMKGNWYVRRKSSLTKKKFYKKACFERSRQSASRFGGGSRIASRLYKNLPFELREVGLYRQLMRKAIAYLKEGKTELEVVDLLAASIGVQVNKAEEVGGKVTNVYGKYTAKGILNREQGGGIFNKEQGILNKEGKKALQRIEREIEEMVKWIGGISDQQSVMSNE
ncbi:MAG TPA: hypothetical protein VHK91_16135 [Flavisolibacter sp.]|jgi:hypothetical protein|nr:hypothetical protein [Flavisolibacter sp.]